jgi:hypothetical protein
MMLKEHMRNTINVNLPPIIKGFLLLPPPGTFITANYNAKGNYMITAL